MNLRDKNIIAITGPSGAGKTTLAEKIKNNNNNVGIPRHCTTRKPRKDDSDGFYRYLTHEEYNELYQNHEFLISSGDGTIIDKKYGNFYGVLIDDCIELCKEYNTIILFVSYKDLSTLIKLKAAGYNINLINLTFKNIQKGVKDRLSNNDRDHTEEEIQKRINCAEEYEIKFGKEIKEFSTSVVYTDVLEQEETYKKVLEDIKILKK